MLHRTLKPLGGDVAHHGHGHAAHAAKKLIPGSAGYYNRTDLGWVHGHREMNYRKKSLGFKAYTKEHMDIWAPFANKAPFRHMETATPGMWFAAGHNDLFSGAPNRYWGKTFLFMVVPFPYMYFCYRFRFAKGGYVQKNVGAVFGA